MDRPFFTVVVPTYRRPTLLREALASVAAQTLVGSQLVVVDDAADSETRSVVAEFPDALYVVNDRGRGGSGSRNKGASLAKGDWIAFLDDDDTWLPHKLASVKALIEDSDDRLVMVYSASEQMDAATGATLSRSRPTARGHVLDDVLYRNVVGGMSVVVVRRDVFEAVGGLDETFPSLQDMELYVRLAERGTFDFVDDVLVRFRVGSHGRITFDGHRKLAGARAFARKYESLLATRPRHRSRAAARLFLFALAAGSYGEALRCLPTLATGILVDPASLSYLARGIARQVRGALIERAPSAVNT